MSIPEISEAIIRHNSNASSYSRGEEYYRRGAIAGGIAKLIAS
ncbi:hypothetical protein [Nostoc flagelliforme]|nr:hypothetical protein [Nostoc flagelliforme]